MRFAAWAALMGAFAMTALAAKGLVELRGAPPLVRELAAPDEPVVLTVMTPKGLVVIRQSSAWLVRASLEAQHLGWPDTVPGIAEVRSADWHREKLALVARTLDGRSVLLNVDQDRVQQMPMHEAYDPVAVEGGDVFFVATGEGVRALCYAAWFGETRVTAREECHLLQAVGPRALRGLVFVDDKWLIAFGEGEALGFVDKDEQPEEAPAVIHGPGFLPPRGSGAAPAMFVDDSARGALRMVGREVVLSRDGARVAIDRQGKMQPIGTSRARGGEFVAHRRRPDGWLVLSERADEALLLDDKLQRVDEGRAPLALTGLSFGAWAAILSALALVLLVAPVLWWRARRKLRGLDGANTLVGTLKLPPCETLEGTGRLALPQGSLLVMKGIEYELTSGLTQLDGGVPLVDGDSVCVVGSLERGGEAGGPWRDGGPRRIVPDRGRYLVARGESMAWVARLAHRANTRLFVAAAAFLGVAAIAQRLLSRL